jgi:thiol-disulfide isomerase/thioredoxin
MILPTLTASFDTLGRNRHNATHPAITRSAIVAAHARFARKSFMMDYAKVFETGLSYHDFLAKYGTSDQQRRWAGLHADVRLSEAQRQVLSSFKRQMPVIVLAGAWCGDCVNQCPIFDHFAKASSVLDIRFFDRDANPELAAEMSVCGAARVPAVLFFSEDWFRCGLYGDRTLSKYRQMTADFSGAACPTGIGSPERTLLDNVVQEWLNEFERIQLMLRTSARLRKLHGD